MSKRTDEWHKLSQAVLWDNQGYARYSKCDACQEALSEAVDRIDQLEARLALAEAVCTSAAIYFELRGAKGQLGSPSVAYSCRDKVLEMLEAWRAAKEAGGNG